MSLANRPNRLQNGLRLFSSKPLTPWVSMTSLPRTLTRNNRLTCCL